MSDIDDMEEEIMTPEGIAQYANALITVQRKEQIPIMAEIKAKQEYASCDEDEKELFTQIIGGYLFTADDCLPELDDCYMQLTIKKSEAGVGFDISCTFCREKQGKCYWFNISPADYFMISSITFLFYYLYLLIVGLDDPFDISNDEINVDLKTLDRFKQRLISDFLV